MTRRDHLVVGVLLLAFAFVAAVISVPAFVPVTAAPVATPPTSEAGRAHVEGVVGVAERPHPLTARSQADRDIVALVFSGLVRLGRGGAVVPDIATSWTMSPDGATWTFMLRPDAVWHDGVPLTADDVVFTIETLQNPDYGGPGGASWTDVVATAVDDHTVRFHLTSPIAGFIYAATQPIVPAHLLRGIPIAELPDSDVGRRPVGSGPFRMIRLDPEAAFLSPAALLAPPEEFIAGSTAPPATDALATPAPTRRPNRPLPYLPSIEFRFFDDPAALARAYRAGEIDAASGLPADVASDLGGRADSRLVRYPGSTVTTVLLNLRPDHPQFRTADVRRGLLTAIKRTVIATSILFSTARAASGPIPPASWAFDSAAAPAEPYDPSAAAKALGDAGWTRAPAGWSLPGTTAILTIELLTPDSTSHPTAALTAARVADDWRAIGLEVSVVELSAADYAARLRSGDFDAAIADLNLGLDPDLYPLLASSQVTERGTNVIGLQDPELDELLTAARAPGALETRVAAYAAIQARVAAQDYLLPLVFPDRVVVFRDTVEGPRIRQVSDLRDRFWDVLTWRLADGR